MIVAIDHGFVMFLNFVFLAINVSGYIINGLKQGNLALLTKGIRARFTLIG